MMDWFSLLVIPGVLFISVLGLACLWLERKITARVQWRIGPPLLSSISEIYRLLTERIKPTRAGVLHFLAGVITLLALALISEISFISFSAKLLAQLLLLPSLSFVVASVFSGERATSTNRRMTAAFALDISIAILVLTAARTDTLTISHLLACLLAFVYFVLRLSLPPFSAREDEEVEIEILEIPSPRARALFELSRGAFLLLAPLILLRAFASEAFISAAGEVLFVVYSILFLAIVILRATNPYLTPARSSKLSLAFLAVSVITYILAWLNV